MTDTNRSYLIYLAGPIDDVTIKDARWWRDELKKILQEMGHNTFDPSRAYNQSDTLSQHATECSEINRYAILHCHMLIAYLAGKGRGFGTIREIEYARAACKPVIVVADGLASFEARDVYTIGSRGFSDTALWRDIIHRVLG